MSRMVFACSSSTRNSPFGPRLKPRVCLNGMDTFPSAIRFRWPQVTFSEMLRLSSWARLLMMVISSSPFPSNVQMFSFSK